MRSTTLRPLSGFIFVTVLMDWILGALCATKVLPLSAYLLFNLPFGGFYVWMESSWVGTHYVMAGRVVGDLGSLAIWLVAAVAQGVVYYGVWRVFGNHPWRKPVPV